MVVVVVAAVVVVVFVVIVVVVAAVVIVVGVVVGVVRNGPRKELLSIGGREEYDNERTISSETNALGNQFFNNKAGK